MSYFQINCRVSNLDTKRGNPFEKEKTIQDFYKMKNNGEKITFLPAYDFPTAASAEEAGLDILPGGDSLGMCVFGYKGTVPVVTDQMIYRADTVRRGAPDNYIIGYMPFMSYQSSTKKPWKIPVGFSKMLTATLSSWKGASGLPK